MSAAGEEKVLVAVILAPHGVRGAVSAEQLSDNPRRFVVGATLCREDGTVMTITAASHHKGRLLLSFAGVEDRNAAERLRGLRLYAPDTPPPLAEGSYYHYQLLGMQVYDRGQLLGELSAVLPYTANDVYLGRRPDGGETLVPALRAVVRQVDVAAQRMDVELPEGL